MRTLSERDASGLLGFVTELHELDDPLPFPPRLLARLRQLVPSDEASYSELDPDAQASILQVRHHADGDDEIVAGSGHPARDEKSRLWWRLRHTHPVCGHRTATGEWTTPYKASDFATLSEFRQTPIYDAFYRGVLDYWLDVGLRRTSRRTRVFILKRHGGRDFDERDKLVLKLLRPRLTARADAVVAAARAAAAIAELEGAGDDAACVVLCSARGVIEFASPSARELLARYLGIHSRVPEGLLAKSTFFLAHDGRRLHAHVARIGRRHMLVLDERDTRVDRLTARERQILDRVAFGEENDQIALTLGIAAATVAKHLEHIYRKLDVPNRTAAVAVLTR